MLLLFGLDLLGLYDIICILYMIFQVQLECEYYLIDLFIIFTEIYDILLILYMYVV